MDEMSCVLTQMSYVLQKSLLVFLFAFFSLPLIFAPLVASFSHFEFLTTAIKF